MFSDLLKPSGLLVLELYPMPKELKYRLEYYTHELEDNELTYTTWDELPSEDPFRYYMSRISYNLVTRVLNHEKVFIHKDGFVDEGKRHAVRVYDMDEILILLDKNGFKIKEICGGWDGSDYLEGRSREIIICASKKEK